MNRGRENEALRVDAMGEQFPIELTIEKALAKRARRAEKQERSKEAGRMRRKTKRHLRRWRAEMGEVCPGAREIGHGPHKVLPPDELTIDHILPLGLNGGNELSNLRVLCGRHNHDKGGELLDDKRMTLAKETSLRRYWGDEKKQVPPRVSDASYSQNDSARPVQ